MELLQKKDTFNLFFSNSSNRLNLATITSRLNQYDNLTLLQKDIVNIIDSVIQECENYDLRNIKNTDSKTENESTQKKTHTVPYRTIYNSLYYNEAIRLKSFCNFLFEEAKSLDPEQTVLRIDYTDYIIQMYIESISDFVQGVDHIDEYIKWINQ